MCVFVLNCYLIDVNGLVDISLSNTINMFVPINYSYNSNFFYEDSLSYSNILDQFYYSQKQIVYE